MTNLKQSYVHGTSDKQLIGDTIGAYFDAKAQAYADKDALVVRHQNIRWTYQELKEQVDTFAVSLMKIGLEPGDRIGIWSPNCAEWLITQLATAKLGLILVNINPAYRLYELEYALKKVSCKALVTADRFKDSDYLGMIKNLAPEVSSSAFGNLNAEKLPDLKYLIQIGDLPEEGFLSFKELMTDPTREELDKLEEIGKQLQFDDPINIQFTSGTTGSPKGATLTHHNILNNGYFIGDAMKLSSADSVCIPVPLYHCFGMVLGNLACIAHGSQMVYPSATFEPETTLKAVAEEQCTALYGVPTMFIGMLDHPILKDLDVSSLRTGIMAGSPCPIAIMKRVVDEMNMSEVTICYGMTETSPVSFQTALDDPLDKKVGTVGRIHPHVEVKIVNEQGKVVPTGESGELCTRGYSVMVGYWNDEQRTTESIDQSGWMHTGDLATLDEQGYGNIVGRIKDMIIRGGENIYPTDIEGFLYKHPKITDVQVFGVPDPKYGEAVCTWIQVKENEALTEEEVREYCQGNISHQKIPKYIRMVDEYPMTITGKIQKFKMREVMIDELNLKEEATA